MSENPKRNDDCLRGGCERWFSAVKLKRNLEECERCGFNKEEDARRKALPLVMGSNGLRHIVIPAKPPIEREVVSDERRE